MKITKVELLVLKSEGLYNNPEGAEEPLGPTYLGIVRVSVTSPGAPVILPAEAFSIDFHFAGPAPRVGEFAADCSALARPSHGIPDATCFVTVTFPP